MGNKSRLIIVIGVFVILPILLWLIFSGFNQKISTGVSFSVTPENVKVSYNNTYKTVGFGTTIALDPGKYSFELSLDGFESIEKDIEIVEGEISRICVGLSPVNDLGREVLSNQVNLTTKSEGIFGCRGDQGSKELEEKFPFLNELPITDKYFSVLACRESGEKDSDYILCVTLVIDNEFHRQRSLNIIKSSGIDVSKTSIRYLKLN